MKERNPAELEQRSLSDNPAKGKASNDAIEQDPKRIVHFTVEHLHGPEGVIYEPDELVVVCLVRDGRPYVKSFIEHYFSLGAKHIAFLDNGSIDGTVEALKNYENVTMLRSTLPFKEYDVLFKQYLIGRFGKKERWCLCVDIDELFDYPYSDVVGLGSFLGYLNANSYTAVAAQMLDMFPEEPLSGRASDPDEPLKERHRFYDLSNLKRMSIKKNPRLRNNTLESDEIETFRDGIENTVFGTKPLRTKFPLVFSDGRVKPFDRSSHWVDNARIADFTCVLFHYKFLDGYFHKQAAQAVREGQYHNDSARYKKYLEVMDKNPTLQMKRETARELKSVNELVENGLLVVSEEYMMAVYDEERTRSAGHAPRPGEQGGPEDEAAFYRVKAEAKVQSLRAQRLERQVEELRKELREPNRRVEKVREQNQREVERLSRILARVRKKNRNLTRRNRNLRSQLRSIQASRILRLLNKLALVRARVLGRKG